METSRGHPATQAEPAPPKSGDLLAGKYRLIEPIGRGGMGQVWTAINLATGAEVAVKLLLPEHALSADAIARFRREAHATAQLAHRGIVRVFDLVELDAPGSLAIVMERLHGRTLSDVIAHGGPMPIEQGVPVVLCILHALHYAHAFGVVHRDLKPENVLLACEPDGEIVPKLVDFGVSKVLRATAPPITIDGMIVGTPCHMSPEQSRGVPVDHRADVFGAGILLHIVLTGYNPFERETLTSALEAVLLEEPRRPPTIPLPIWRVIARALAKRPEHRYANALEFADALAHAANMERPARSSGAPPATTRSVPAPPNPPAMKTWQRAAVVAAAACVAGMAFAITPDATMAKEPRARAAHASAVASPRRTLASSRDTLVVAPIAPTYFELPETFAPPPTHRAPTPTRSPHAHPTSMPAPMTAAAAPASATPHGLTRAAKSAVLRDPGF